MFQKINFVVICISIYGKGTLFMPGVFAHSLNWEQKQPWFIRSFKLTMNSNIKCLL